MPPGRKPNAERRAREYLTEAEVEKLCQVARKRGRYGARDATMILICYRHGLRVGELVNVRWTQLDLDAGRFHVNRLKGSENSVHPLSGAEIRALRAIRRDQPADARHVFLSERGAPISTAGFARMLTRTAEAAGLGELKVHPHALRHGCGYKLANDGHDTRALQLYLGHRQIQHTVRYTALAAGAFDGFRWRE
jgi:integrase